jgi:hypothetical protein
VKRSGRPRHPDSRPVSAPKHRKRSG